MITTPNQLLARPVSWITSFAPEALDILGRAFMGDFTAQELATHRRWRQTQMLLTDLGLVDFMDRSLAELQRDEVLTPEVVSAICQGYIEELTKGGASDAQDKELRLLEDTEFLETGAVVL